MLENRAIRLPKITAQPKLLGIYPKGSTLIKTLAYLSYIAGTVHPATAMEPFQASGNIGVIKGDVLPRQRD